MKARPIEFSSKELMLEYAKKLIKKRFNCDAEIYLNQSTILMEMKNQEKLAKYL